MHRATMPPQRRTDGADTGSPRTLLLPQFLACARNQLLVFGSVGAGAVGSAVMFDRFPQQIFIDRAEYFIGKIKGSDFFPAQIMNIDSCHMSLPYGHSPLWPMTDDRRLSLSLLGCPLRRLQRIHRGC